MTGPDEPARILLVLAHPALERARLTPPLVEAARSLPGVTVRDLYELYPDFTVDARAEQQLLVGHEVIVLQFPLFWYSAPALLKEWLDSVWLNGFAYGRGGQALRGKTLMCAVSTGANAAAFTAEGEFRHTLEEFLRPFEAAARHCGLTWAEPFVAHGREPERPVPPVQAYRARLAALAAEAAARRADA